MTHLTKNIIALMAKIYYREKLQSRNSEGEKCMSRVWRKPVEASKNSLPVVTQSAQLQQWVVITCAKGCVRAVQLFSRVRLFEIPWIAARQASLSITNSRSSPRLTSIESVMPSSHLILFRPLLLLPPIPPSIWVFSNDIHSYFIIRAVSPTLQVLPQAT